MTGPIIAIAKIAFDVAAGGEVEVHVPIAAVDTKKLQGLLLTCRNDSGLPMAIDIDMTVRPDPDE